MKIKKIAIIVSLIFLLLIPCFIFAQETNLEMDYPEIAGTDSETVKSGLPGYVKYIFNLGIVLAGMVAFGALIKAGITYLTAVGNPEKLKEGKDGLVSAFLGLIILLSSYMILASINPQLVIFKIPILSPIKTSQAPLLTEWQDDEMSLIATELPIGQAIEKGLWSETMRNGIKELVNENEEFLKEEIKVNPSFESIADLNKHLLSLTEDCRCEELTGVCTEPKNYRVPIGCVGDPCPDETRKEIEKVLDINQDKIKKLLTFQKRVTEKKAEFEEELSKFVNIENEIIYCQQQTGSLLNLNDHISRLDDYQEQGWQVKTQTFPGVPEASADPLTFYCTIGGTVSDYPYTLFQSLPTEITESEIIEITDSPIETAGFGRFNCPAEIPLGEIIDNFRELAVLMIVKMEKLAEFQGRMALKIDEMKDLVSRCNDEYCNINCDCVPNPCYEPACGTPPGRVNSCGIGRCTPPTPLTPNFCYPFCNSPCLQSVGGCSGSCSKETYEELAKKINDCIDKDCPEEEMEKIYQNLKSCPDACPRNEITNKVLEIGKIEYEIFETINEINQIFPLVSYLLENNENPKNLRNIRAATGLCHSSEREKITWTLVSAPTAIGNYGASGQIINRSHPRNFFCCLFSEEEILSPWEGQPFLGPVSLMTVKEYEPLPLIDGCPKGWLCENDIKSYNQYDDASEQLKELLSCMREELDKTIKEKELNKKIGLISVISDPKLAQGTCGWESGPLAENGCSHTYEIKYGKERVSAHYGGTDCRFLKKSFAVNFSDTENSEYLMEAAKKCRPDSFIAFRTAGHYKGLHISIGQAEYCGVN
jgi:hypothetical protein